MTRRARVALATLALGVLVAAEARAEDDVRSLRKPVLIYVTAASLDVASTAYCLSAGCVERNPLIAWLQPTSPHAMIAVGEAVDMTALWAWTKVAGKRRPKLARVVLYATAAVRIGLTVNNIRHGLRQREHNRRLRLP